MRGFRAVLAITLTTSLGVAGTGTAAAAASVNHSKSVTTMEVSSALDGAPRVINVAPDSDVTVTPDAVVMDGERGITAEVPLDPKKGVILDSGQEELTIELPDAKKAGKGKVVDDGLVAYPSSNGAASAVQVVEGDGAGAVQMLSVIDSPSAPTEFTYELDLPEGSEVRVLPDGAGVFDAEGNPLVAVAAPWATDANGKSVETWYSTDGTSLTQHVSHTAAGVAYPVVADPYWIPLAVIAVTVQRAFYACGLGYLAGSAWEVFWNGWVWEEVRRSGRQGCVEGVITGAGGWMYLRYIKR